MSRQLGARLLVATLALAALAWPVGAFGTSSPAEQAVQLLTRARQAAGVQDFTGLATVTWRDDTGRRSVQVDVTDDGGTIEARVGDNVVYDSGNRTFVKDGNRWSSIVVDSGGRDVPEASSNWKLTTATGPRIAGRATTEVIATRRDGSVAQRIAVDDATGLLLRRQVFTPRGSLERSLTFTEFTVADAVTSVTAPAGVRSDRADVVTTLPEGYVAPRTLGAATLVTRTKQPDGVLLWYSDGLFSTTLLEQPGTLDWASLPEGGTDIEVRGTTMRRWSEPNGTQLVWERNGIVFTCVSDAPGDVVDRAVVALTDEPRSALERAADFVLGPFGWR